MKQYFIKQTKSTFDDRLIYDLPFTKGEQLTTYSIGTSDFAIQDLDDELAHMWLGFVNFRYTQGDQI